MKSEPLVSIVIPTWNSEKTLTKCLESVKNQTYKNTEIIVVDKFSKDRTIEIARKYTNRIFVVKAKERTEQVNFGIKDSKGRYIYRIDSDFVLESTVVEEAVNKCEKEDYDAIAIHNTSDPTISFWSKVRKFERDCYKYDELNIAARFFRKDVFDSIGGFDESLVSGEDYDFHNRLLKKKFKVGRINAQETHIGEPKSLWEVAKKHYYYGKTLVKFIGKKEYRGIKQLSPVRPAFIKNWKKFIKYPILTLGFIIYQFVRYASAGLGYLVESLSGK
jgi:glycosyltransferase involved in cell wall biosynthesis